MSPHWLIQLHGVHSGRFTFTFNFYTTYTEVQDFQKQFYFTSATLADIILSKSGQWVPDNSVWFCSSLSLLKSTYNNVTTNWTLETHQIISCRPYFKMWHCVLYLILWLRFFRAFSSVVRQMPEYKRVKEWGTARGSCSFFWVLLYCTKCYIVPFTLLWLS